MVCNGRRLDRGEEEENMLTKEAPIALSSPINTILFPSSSALSPILLASMVGLTADRFRPNSVPISSHAYEEAISFWSSRGFLFGVRAV